MQFVHALDRILREILLADPSLGPVRLIKIDLSDGFYCIGLNIDDNPKLGAVFPMKPGHDPLIVLLYRSTISQDIAYNYNNLWELFGYSLGTL